MLYFTQYKIQGPYHLWRSLDIFLLPHLWLHFLAFLILNLNFLSHLLSKVSFHTLKSKLSSSWTNLAAQIIMQHNCVLLIGFQRVPKRPPLLVHSILSRYFLEQRATHLRVRLCWDLNGQTCVSAVTLNTIFLSYICIIMSWFCYTLDHKRYYRINDSVNWAKEQKPDIRITFFYTDYKTCLDYMCFSVYHFRACLLHKLLEYFNRSSYFDMTIL